MGIFRRRRREKVVWDESFDITMNLHERINDLMIEVGRIKNQLSCNHPVKDQVIKNTQSPNPFTSTARVCTKCGAILESFETDVEEWKCRTWLAQVQAQQAEATLDDMIGES